MPSSRPYTLTFICNQIINRQPKSVLDIGVGFGKMGLLVREYTDVWNERYPYYKPGKPNKTQTRIDGVEIHAPYICTHHDCIYDDIYIGDALNYFRDKADQIPVYDMILCCDMLEHYDYSNGTALLHQIKSNSQYAIVTTPHPRAYTRQGAVYGNQHETHRHCWSSTDLKVWGPVFTFNGVTNLLEMTDGAR